MHKKLLFAALAGLAASTTFAQSNVTIYGIADIYVARSVGNGQNLNTVGDGGYSPFRVGFRGTEDLGDGWQALFLLEYWTGQQAETGAGLTGSRQQYVGLSKNNLGTLTAGYQYNPGADVYGSNAPSTVVGVYSSNQIQTAIGNNEGSLRSLAGASRWSNSIKYTSPTFYGFTVSAAYAAAESVNSATNTDNSTNSKWGFNTRFAQGPLGIDFAYILQKDKQNVTVSNEKYDVKEFYIGGRYDFGMLKTFATYQTLRTGKTLNAAYDHDAWTLGVKVPVGQHAINLEYAAISFDPANSVTDQHKNGTSSSYSVGYEHNLSKRTMLYTALAYTKNDANVPAAAITYWNTDKLSNGTTTAAAGHGTSSFMLGMRHLF